MDEEEPREPPDYAQAGLPVGDGSVSGLVCQYGSVWAARLPAGEVTVTVVGRGVDRGSAGGPLISGWLEAWPAWAGRR